MKKCFYYFISLLILLPIKSHAQVDGEDLPLNPPTLCISTTEEFVDYKFYQTLYPLCRHCWRVILTPNMIVNDNFFGTFELQHCKLLKNKKNYIKYECTNLYNPKKTDIFEFTIERWDPIFKAYVVKRNNIGIDGRRVRKQTYVIRIPKQEKN
ncbi:MAG: hypothetical protein SO314_08585 [Alphaproteobacteria bacterium]|nr:hypothetical protein [Alphaproteobacteria bacterium]